MNNWTAEISRSGIPMVTKLPMAIPNHWKPSESDNAGCYVMCWSWLADASYVAECWQWMGNGWCALCCSIISSFNQSPPTLESATRLKTNSCKECYTKYPTFTFTFTFTTIKTKLNLPQRLFPVPPSDASWSHDQSDFCNNKGVYQWHSLALTIKENLLTLTLF